MMAEWIVRMPGNPATEVRFVSSRSRMLFPVNVIAQFNEHLFPSTPVKKSTRIKSPRIFPNVSPPHCNNSFIAHARMNELKMELVHGAPP